MSTVVEKKEETVPSRDGTARRTGSMPDPAVLSFMTARVKNQPHNTAFSVYEEGFWRSMSYAEIRHRSNVLSSWLIEQSLQHGSRVAVLSESKPEWGIAFFTIVRAGGVVLPLDRTLTIEELEPIIQDAQPSAILASATYLETAETLCKRVHGIEHIIVMEDESLPGRYQSYRELKPSAGVIDVRERQWDELAVLTYTSGTTGTPKGVMTSFQNLGFEVDTLMNIINVRQGETTVSILPLSHLLELVGGFLCALYSGSTIAYINSLFPQDILRAMKDQSATRMVAVPLFFNMVKKQIDRQIRKSSKMKRLVFWFLFHVCAPICPIGIRRIMFRTIHQEFGGHVRYFMSGAAPLNLATEIFFERIGLPIYQGYGLTETSPVASINTEDHHSRGTVGKPLPDTEVRIAEDGEVLVRGKHVTQGYYKLEDLTAQAIDGDGWFHTGDLGSFDSAGYLTINGRKKNLIVLGSGKKVQPEEVEQPLEASHLFKEVCVLGLTSLDELRQGQEEVGCVVVPSDEALGLHPGPKAMARAMEDEVSRRCKVLAGYKQPSCVIVHSGELPTTTTKKIKRTEVRALVNELRRENHDA
jgi:long-chain acyl-CoA synthetase